MQPGRIQRYALALGLVLLCLLIGLWAYPVQHDRALALLFILPVVVSAWRGSLGSSLLATGLGLAVVRWFFMEPRYGFSVQHGADLFALGAYLGGSLVVCGCAERMRRGHQRLAERVAATQAQQQALEQEISDQKRAEEARLESAQHYETVIEAIPQLVWRATADGTTDYLSTQWELFTGVPRAELLTAREPNHLYPGDRQRASEAWAQAVKTGSEADFDIRLRARDGSYRWFKNRALPLRDQAGRVVKWCGSCTDITSLVEALDTATRRREDLERQLRERTSEVERLRHKLEGECSHMRVKPAVQNNHVGIAEQSAAIRHVLAQVDQVAPTDATVLLLGETGTGKELLASAIHGASSRRDRPMVSVNCAALPSPLVESELFGRERGAFTGSLSRQVGRFELADNSTIFLDEIGDLSAEVQVKLLRVVEHKQIERLGNPKPLPVDVRIIAATNLDLAEAVGKGRFRSDLYYRLNVFPILVPPLRERREDIPLLVWAFVDEFAKTLNKNIESVDAGSMDALRRYSWPGNVRELRNLVERAMIMATGPKLYIDSPSSVPVAGSNSAQNLEEVERSHVLTVLKSAGWRIRGPGGAAARLGLKPTTLEARMIKLGLHRP